MFESGLLSPKIRKPDHNLPISINSPFWLAKIFAGDANVSLLPIRYFILVVGCS
jgi:hypothetical protein